MISVKNLIKEYGDKTVLNIPDLSIPKGQSFGLVGNNGAGKTTFFNLLLDLIKPTQGEVINHKKPVQESEDWKTFTTAFIDESFLIGYLTPEEYFYFIGDLRGQDKTSIDEFLSNFKAFFNNEVLNQKKYIRDLSKGNQKKVGLIAALIGNPEVIILDEPFANLDPTTQIRLKKILKDLSENQEKTLLISSHDLGHVTEVTDRIVVLDKGKMVNDIQTTPETLKELEQFFNV
ncbi:MAG TPA: ABC transporter ATP-binding protein [Flavobacteriales bacterium]|jgi:ABC-2 type transport system ATP-binding protein|nr:ABC transporter ATP-binding protein [Flavobacteriales bacterium]